MNILTAMEISNQWSPTANGCFVADTSEQEDRNNNDVALVNASEMVKSTMVESGYTDSNAKWVLDGKAMIWERTVPDTEATEVGELESDVYIMFFDLRLTNV